jgi:hypothetical protein
MSAGCNSMSPFGSGQVEVSLPEIPVDFYEEEEMFFLPCRADLFYHERNLTPEDRTVLLLGDYNLASYPLLTLNFRFSVITVGSPIAPPLVPRN